LKSLLNKTALICGSTQGIGKASALKIAEMGATICLIARNEEKLKQTLLELPNDTIIWLLTFPNQMS
jgi:3-oxoacyl-[acyl-carrier protein] reductase